MKPPWLLAPVLFFGLLAPLAYSQDTESAARRGRKILETRAFTTGVWSSNSFDNAWKYWQKKENEKPADYSSAYRDYYGLHPAPYSNGKYPMGIREGTGLLGKAVVTDCLLCHGGSILGKSYIGLGNSTLDIQALFQDMGKASGSSGKLPFTFSNVRGTSEAAAFAVFLMGYRQPDLQIRLQPINFGLRDDLCEDVPAWWLLKKKKTMYYTGTTPARSVRSIMQFMLASTWGPQVFAKEEATFKDIQAFLLSLEAPKYPLGIDQSLARTGEKIFNQNCSTCHGTYGEKWTYPNKIIPMNIIQTDPNRFEGLSTEWGHYYNKSWFARERPGWFFDDFQVHATRGYQAPPLDGVWATAPYLHNGSVPTIYHVLNSKARPAIFTRSFQTGEKDYDQEKLGWKFQEVRPQDLEKLSPHDRRKVYDTRLSGRRNGGHTFGDDLTEDERRAVIEYLKKL